MKMLVTLLDSSHHDDPILQVLDIDDAGLTKDQLQNLMGMCFQHVATSLVNQAYPEEPQSDDINSKPEADNPSDA